MFFIYIYIHILRRPPTTITNPQNKTQHTQKKVVRKNFRHLLFAHVLRAKDLPKEANLMDRVLQGGSADPDPFAVVEVLSSHGSDIAITKAAVRVFFGGCCCCFGRGKCG